MPKKNDTPKPASNKWERFCEEDSAPEAEADQVVTNSSALKEEPSGESTAGLEFPSHDKLEQQLTAMELKLEEYKSQNYRLSAELENTQARAKREISRAHQFGSEALAKDLLPVIDSIVRGLEAADFQGNTAYQSLREGMSMTLELLEKTLQKHGIEVIAPEQGEMFNPEHHEAMSMQPDAKASSNTVLQVLQKGYLLNGRVLRAAMVIVAS